MFFAILLRLVEYFMDVDVGEVSLLFADPIFYGHQVFLSSWIMAFSDCG